LFVYFFTVGIHCITQTVLGLDLGGYTIPKGAIVDDYRGAIEDLPDVDSPEVFGLHPNADITYQTNTANQVMTDFEVHYK